MRSQRILIGLVLSAAAACQEHTVGLPSEARPIEVRARAIRRGDISEVITVSGETLALGVVRLASPVTGRVTFLTAQPGDYLDANAVAARVISVENDAALQGFAFLESAAARAPDERARAEHLQRDLRRRDIPLRAPFAAVVAERLHNPDERVAQNDVLLELFDPQSLYALAQVPMDSAARIRTGMPAEVRTGGVTLGGQVAAIAAALTPQTLTVPVRIQLATSLHPPLLHAALEIRITLARHANALLIPRSALLSSNVADEGTVMVAMDHTARRHAIRLGLRSASEVEVSGGLTDGDIVLTDGQYALPDEAPIEPQVDASER